MAGSPSTVKYSAGRSGAGVGEHDLMRQRGLAAAGGAGDDVEGVLGQAAAEDFIEARHAGGQLPNGHSILVVLDLVLACSCNSLDS